MAAGAGSTMISNAYEGKELKEGVLKSVIIAGVTGGIASSASKGTTQLIGVLGTNTSRIAVQTTSGALISGTTGALGCILNNILNLKKIEKHHLVSYLKSCGASQSIADMIWVDLADKQYIENYQFTQQCDKGITLRVELLEYEDIINEVYILSKDIWKDVWESAASSVVVGGALTGIVTTSRVLRQKNGATINRPMRNIKPKGLTKKKGFKQGLDED